MRNTPSKKHFWVKKHDLNFHWKRIWSQKVHFKKLFSIHHQFKSLFQHKIIITKYRWITKGVYEFFPLILGPLSLKNRNYSSAKHQWVDSFSLFFPWFWTRETPKEWHFVEDIISKFINDLKIHFKENQWKEHKKIEHNHEQNIKFATVCFFYLFKYSSLID